MVFLCKVLVVSPESELLSQFSNFKFQVLPTERQYLLLKAEEGKPLVTQVEAVVPVVDLPLGASIRHVIFLRVVTPDRSPNFMNLGNIQG